MNQVDTILEKKPYSDTDHGDFVIAMRGALRHHYKNSPHFKKFIDTQKFDPMSDFTLEDIPFIPVALFKEMELITGNIDAIQKKIYSSSTTGNKPSMIALDQITIDRQRKALFAIMSDFLGTDRHPFIIFDVESTAQAREGAVSSRGAAIRGILPFASQAYFVLNDDLSINLEKFEEALAAIGNNKSVYLFGFTWVVYTIIEELKSAGYSTIVKRLADIGTHKKLIHIGGWKKLRDVNISKEDFNKQAAEIFSLSPANVMDIYGITEQLGTVYPDCKEGYKHVSAYADVIIRDTKTFTPSKVGETGFIQFLSPIPHSYPGISIITDDMGEIVGLDGCPCGRRGKYFVFKKRHEAAELRGCGDTI